MPRCNIVVLKFKRTFEKFVEFEISVAVNARVWRCALCINVNKFSDYFFSEIIGEVENIKRNSDFIGNASCVL